MSSSRPSPPRKTRARSPRAAKTPAISGASERSATPTAEASTRAGFVIGPRKLKAVATRSCARAAAAKRIDGWKVWAKRNVMPTCRAADSTISTGRSSRTPSASRTSAEPDFEDDARLPCLTTFAPAPAHTRADIVEMLTLESRSPPVPTMSRAGPGMSTGRALPTMASASPVSSSTVSPFARRATRKPAMTTSDTSPDMIVSMAQ